MVSHENSPTSNPPRARVCATCHDLGTVESPLPGMHVLCPTCCNGTRRPSEPGPLPFTLPPESPVSEAERAEGDRPRSEERRVGTEWVSQGKLRGVPYH